MNGGTQSMWVESTTSGCGETRPITFVRPSATGCSVTRKPRSLR